MNADDALHHADLNFAVVEHAALLDMQLKVGRKRARLDASVGETRGILSVAAQPVGEGLSFPSLRSSASAESSPAAALEPSKPRLK